MAHSVLHFLLNFYFAASTVSSLTD